MPRRDDELDELERQLRPDDPHLEMPDKRATGDGSMCWRDKERLCGGDCVAYNFGGYGLSPDDPVQAHQQCMLIVIRLPQVRVEVPTASDLAAKKRAEDQAQETALRGLGVKT